MKVVIYEYELMKKAGKLLNELTVSGTGNFRILAELANILDSGKTGEYEEKKEDKENGVDCKEVQ